MPNQLRILLFIILTTISLPTLAEDNTTEPSKAIYFVIDEPFTINFLNQSQQQVRYLQIRVALMAYSQQAITNAKANLPMLQDALRSLFAEQSFNTVNSIEGREALQSSAIKSLNTLLKEQVGSKPLDAVYFTSFVLQ